tara:strand:+ start:1507 stop:2202 length:696 start_codon:yes stop_codon:yes gene_type:complete
MIRYLTYLYYLFYRPKIFFPKRSYSLFGEDIFLNKYFKKKKKGFYIDVGCYHPLSGNNTYLLYKKGWKGMNFDISKLSIDLFNFYRKKDINIWCGISNKKGSKKIFYRKKINMLNTLNKDIAKKHFRNGFNIGIVKVNTLNYFLKKFYKASKKIDLLKIDVEGEELKVLHSVDFKHYKPSLISIEIHNQKSMYQDNSYYFKTNKIYKFLIQKNYKLIWKKKYSFIFKRKIN